MSEVGGFMEQITIPIRMIDNCPLKPFSPVKVDGWHFTRGPGNMNGSLSVVEDIIRALK